MDLPALKELVGGDRQVSFTRYFDGNLWYRAEYNVLSRGGPDYFEFPVPISDIGNATFLAQDKAILFMRYIRKHLEALKWAQEHLYP